jgi:hypothetical protein
MNAGDSDTLQSRLDRAGKRYTKVAKIYAVVFALEREARRLEAEAEAIMAKWEPSTDNTRQTRLTWEP